MPATRARTGEPSQNGSPAPAQAPLTLPRALTITGLILGLAAAAHTAGGGHLPPAPVLGLLAVLVLLPVTVLARRRLSLASIAAALGAGQLALHTAFTSLPGPVGHCGPAGIAAHGHHQAQTIPDCAAGTGALTLHVPALPGPLMVTAHVLAVAATALLLAHGETMLWRALAWLAPQTIDLNPSPLPQWTAPAPPRASWIPGLHPAVGTRLLRGPPASSPGTVSV
ncbi:hypothetical protein [Pseudarthrobacter enclensis]|uniref:Multisubunit Na+/H+ antiporter MnhC subunit n=1 Tax=Pseudarthrobacter enclensis TaxID=993070 RepID=A0ABT9RWJ9_9MICC|nr:hypothetical protein [Pseudarthrobacter enclensis]MDP9888594.1 multisubunit Na+/H+ antiporter MnhC subunit [Pseudarthrobacter enclensis]